MAPVGFWGLLGVVCQWEGLALRRMEGFVLEDDEFGLWCYHGFELGEVGEPAIFFFAPPEINLCPEAFGDRVELLICWIVTYYMVAFLEQGVED